MRTIVATLESVSPYSQSRKIQREKPREETSKDFEERTWRERCHVGEDGHLFIPPMAFKNCLSEAAKFLSVQIPGKRSATYTKFFESGVLVIEPLRLPLKLAEVQFERLFVPSDGKRGGGKRVDKVFPLIPSWKGDVTFHVLADEITDEVFQLHLEKAGAFIGIGRFRPRNNGFYGRFKVTNYRAN